MSIYSGGDKQWKDAQIFSTAAQIEQNFADQRAQRRSFLQDIRQARIAQAYNEWAASSTDEYVTASGTAAATGNIFSNFSGAYRYAVDQSASSARIAQLQTLSAKMEKRAAKRDKRAATATQITMAVAALAGGALGAGLIGAGIAGGGTVGAGLGVAAGGVVGKGAVSAMSPGRVARQASTDAAIQYGITGLTMAAGGAMSGSKAAAGGGAVESTGGTIETSWDTTTRTGVTTSWVSPNSAKNFTSLQRLARVYKNTQPFLSAYQNLSRRKYDR